MMKFCLFCKLCFNGLRIWCNIWLSWPRSKNFDFAKKYDLPIKTVVRPENENNFEVKNEAFTGPGIMINSDFLNNLKAPDKSIEEAINQLKKNIGKKDKFQIEGLGSFKTKILGLPYTYGL